MRAFDVYEHPSFDLDFDEVTISQSVVVRLGLGAAVAALAAAGLWRYYWTDSRSLKETLGFEL
ncbi:hypothetical protein FA95DRAFT_1601462 [Auriscalpium vulgare]|uniref:Uncharacterized protein n=1 Tax=Auriscalpium vulgare TaxID=40419 RepID=A0ACB8S990_9AGAM|nr:hypothetical protein FA95DRAFT_1601462 [Auriscalpium vulgare]